MFTVALEHKKGHSSFSQVRTYNDRCLSFPHRICSVSLMKEGKTQRNSLESPIMYWALKEKLASGEEMTLIGKSVLVMAHVLQVENILEPSILSIR